MTIYMTHSRFGDSARALDKKRLDRQIILVGKTIKFLEGDPTDRPGDELVTDAVARAWEGYTAALAWHGLILCGAWLKWKPTSMMDLRTKQAVWFNDMFEDAMDFESLNDNVSRLPEMPPWMGDKNVHRSHRSNLTRKLPQHYESEFPGTPVNMPVLHPQIIDGRSLTVDELSRNRLYRLRLTENDLDLLRRGERKLPDNLHYDEFKNEVLEVA